MAFPSLINPFELEIAPLDTAATAAVNPPGTASDGFDDVFREPRVWNDPTTGARTSARQEGEPYRLRAQVSMGPWDRLQMGPLGDDPETRLLAVASIPDMKVAGMLNDDGRPCVRKGDRLVAVYEVKTGALARTIGVGEELYVTEAREGEFGIGGRRNLLYIAFSRRRAGA